MAFFNKFHCFTASGIDEFLNNCNLHVGIIKSSLLRVLYKETCSRFFGTILSKYSGICWGEIIVFYYKLKKLCYISVLYRQIYPPPRRKGNNLD